MDMDLRWDRIPELGTVKIFRERPISIWLNKYSTTGEVKRRIQVMNENSQMPPDRIRLFREGKELLDDDEKLTSDYSIDVVYGDEQAVHIGNTRTVGVRSSDLVQTLEAKFLYCKNGFQLNGEVLDRNRSISSYNITENNVLELSERAVLSAIPVPLPAEEERHDDAHNDWINNVASTIKGFGGSLRSLKRVLSNEHLKSLAQRVGKPALEMMASNIIGLLKEDSFGLPDILQRASDKILSDQDLVGIADATGENWQLLGYALGLKQSRIDQIALDNHTTVMKVFGMLKRWATENTDGSKAGTLLRAMWDCRSLTVTWETIFQMFA